MPESNRRQAELMTAEVEREVRVLAERSLVETVAGQRATLERILKRWAEAEARRPRKIRPIPERRLA